MINGFFDVTLQWIRFIVDFESLFIVEFGWTCGSLTFERAFYPWSSVTNR